MITNFKMFESIENKLREKIYIAMMELTSVDIDKDFPFPLELKLLHEREYIKDLFFDITWDIPKLTWYEFKSAYLKMLDEAKIKIETEIKNDPSIYSKWKEYFDYEILDIPEYIKQSAKYNL